MWWSLVGVVVISIISYVVGCLTAPREFLDHEARAIGWLCFWSALIVGLITWIAVYLV